MLYVQEECCLCFYDYSIKFWNCSDSVVLLFNSLHDNFYSHPNIRLHFQGKPRIKCDTIPTVIISAVHGKNARRRTAHDNFLNFTISSPSPARVNITVSASFLKNLNTKNSTF